jgi:hypothetical protein
VRDILPSEKLLWRIEWVGGLLLVVMTAGAWFFFSLQMAVGVFLGGAIATLSFQVLKWQLRKAFQTPGKIPRKGGLFASYYARFLGTLFLVFVVMYYGWANPIAFVVGLSVVILSIVMVGGLEYLVMLSKRGDS